MCLNSHERTNWLGSACAYDFLTSEAYTWSNLLWAQEQGPCNTDLKIQAHALVEPVVGGGEPFLE